MMDWRAIVLTATLAAVALPGVGAAQPLGLYDPFNPPAIDGIKWRGTEENVAFGAASPANLEVLRRIVTGRLQLRLRTAGETGSDSGRTGEGRIGLRINHPVLRDHDPEITALQSRVTVVSATAGDCPANEDSTRVRAQLLMFLFNDGSGGPGNFTGDVLAGLSLELRSDGERLIIAFLNRCDTATCPTSPNLRFAVFERQWELGVAETVTIRWLKDSQAIEFTVGAGEDSEIQEIEYGDLELGDASPPILFLKEIRVVTSPENCTAGRVEAAIDARFDSVRIDQAAVDALP